MKYERFPFASLRAPSRFKISESSIVNPRSIQSDISRPFRVFRVVPYEASAKSGCFVVNPLRISPLPAGFAFDPPARPPFALGFLFCFPSLRLLTPRCPLLAPFTTMSATAAVRPPHRRGRHLARDHGRHDHHSEPLSKLHWLMHRLFSETGWGRQISIYKSEHSAHLLERQRRGVGQIHTVDPPLDHVRRRLPLA